MPSDETVTASPFRQTYSRLELAKTRYGGLSACHAVSRTATTAINHSIVFKEN
jgi:hypothetical protein